jgi:outer membrane protein assembly factor BamE (lipoprotein component of BamABCDE complex)
MLVGKEFTSSFKSDNSNFDETKIESIIKGKTTRSEVIQLFGKPSSSFIAPMVKETSGEAIGYVYNTTSGGVFSGFMFTSIILKISFDDSNVVSDIDYVVSSNK